MKKTCYLYCFNTIVVSVLCDVDSQGVAGREPEVDPPVEDPRGLPARLGRKQVGYQTDPERAAPRLSEKGENLMQQGAGAPDKSVVVPSRQQHPEQHQVPVPSGRPHQCCGQGEYDDAPSQQLRPPPAQEGGVRGGAKDHAGHGKDGDERWAGQQLVVQAKAGVVPLAGIVGAAAKDGGKPVEKKSWNSIFPIYYYFNLTFLRPR